VIQRQQPARRGRPGAVGGGGAREARTGHRPGGLPGTVLQSGGDRRGPSAGFTLIELMVVLAVMAVVAGVGIPAFRTFIAQGALTSQVNDFVAAVAEARSQATRLRAPVSIVAVDATDDADEWGPGYCVAEGTPADCPDDAIRRFDATDPNTLNGVGALDTVGILTFNARGVLTNVAALPATIDLCSPGTARGRQLIVSPIGRVQVQEITSCPT
jgi:prepilin-type N-terminal cleavage/methylation domain-containing protein